MAARVPAQTWVAVGGFCALWIAFGSLIAPAAKRHDFLNLYTGASLALDGNFAHLHSVEVQLARERQLQPQTKELVPFVRLHFYAAILAPLALLPFNTAFWVWIGLQSVVLFLCWGWALRRWGPDALTFGALYLPTALGIAHGQDCVFMLAILIGVYTLLDRKQDLGAGAVLGLGLIKFHLFLLWPLAILLRKRWRMLAGAGASVAAEVAISWLLAGTGGLVEYYRLLGNKDLDRLNPSPELWINVHGLALNLGLQSIAARAALIALVVILAGAAMWRGPEWRWFAAAAVGSLLIAPHVYGYDAALLLLPIWAAIFVAESPVTRIAATTIATPIPFMLTLAGMPWAATTPLALLVFLTSLSFKILPKRMRQSPVSAQIPAVHKA